MDKIIVEVGSTCTKADRYDGTRLFKLEGRTIEFKKHFLEKNILDDSDMQELVDYISELKNISSDILCAEQVFLGR